MHNAKWMYKSSGENISEIVNKLSIKLQNLMLHEIKYKHRIGVEGIKGPLLNELRIFNTWLI